MAKVLVVYYTTYGHIKTMADEVVKGLEEAGCEVTLKQVQETLPQEVLKKLHAPGMSPTVPVIAPEILSDFDGIMFGIPTRFGMGAAQMKALMDATGALWLKGKLVGKPAGVFCSTSGQSGGQETTIMTFVTQCVHHGMIFVPAGYTAGQDMFGMTEVRGSSPWGAGTLANVDGSRMPSDTEKKLAKNHGVVFGKFTSQLVKGRAALGKAEGADTSTVVVEAKEEKTGEGSGGGGDGATEPPQSEMEQAVGSSCTCSIS